MLSTKLSPSRIIFIFAMLTFAAAGCIQDPANIEFCSGGFCNDPLSQDVQDDQNTDMGDSDIIDGEQDDSDDQDIDDNPSLTCEDGILNGDETDIDCGGPDCPACGLNKACDQKSDCASGVCIDGICSLCDPEAPTIGGGDGSEDFPYMICSIDHLNHIEIKRFSHFQLAANLNLGGTHFESIGTSATPFNGTLDGAGFKITNLSLENGGFFSAIGTNGRVENLHIVDAEVVGHDKLGILAGQNAGSIYNVHVSGTVKGQGNFIGGLVGDNTGNIEESSASGTVEGMEYTGGLVGRFDSGTIKNSHSTVDVVGKGNQTGGLVGGYTRGTIENSYATGSVTGISKVGGLIGSGSGQNPSINNSYATGEVIGSGEMIGGLVGYSAGLNIHSSYSTSNVRGGGGKDWWARRVCIRFREYRNLLFHRQRFKCQEYTYWRARRTFQRQLHQRQLHA